MYLDKYIEEHGKQTDYPIFDDVIYKDIDFPTSDLFLAQFKGMNFNAVDIVVKYLAIENYYGLNDFGFDLYKKMQMLRTGKDWNDRFISLIKSVENSYDNESKIETDLNYSIHDGAHRTALALFHNKKNVPVRLFNTSIYRRSYDLSWFYENLFTKEELEIIKNKFNEIVEMINEPYYCILWTPARNKFDEIEKDISKISSDVSILSSENISIKKENIKKFIYDIYSTDDIKMEKLDKKYSAMIKSLEMDDYNSLDYIIRVLKLNLKYPDFRVKPMTGLPQSKETMKLKQIIRDTFKAYVTEYYYDIIMHVTDNTIQNREVEKILEKERIINK